jgi:asparagine synthase (glutamine-hydrolysing)
MCGLIASFNVGNFNKSSAKISLKHLAKRGPDSEGQWRDHGVFLGFRRLSIIDLKSRSNQPMNSLCKKFVIVFNGEIYNFKELKKDLLDKGVKFKTNSDTEVILNLFILEGEKMLIKLRGMFSFVIYNKKTKKAFVARDPYGIKPLYYGKTDDGLIFASQVKTILSLKLIENIIDEQAVELFKILGSVPEPNTFFQKIRSVKAGHFIWIKNGKITAYKKWCDIGRVWKFLNSRDSFEKDKTESALKNSLEETVKYHLVSEVPVGIFLSGGIDSAVLTGLITQSGFKDLIGITVYFEEYLKTRVTELFRW